MSDPALIQVSEGPPVSVPDGPIARRRALAAVKDHTLIDAEGPVFVIDDDDWVCDSLKVLLKAYGFAVETYASGAEFLGDPQRDAAKCLVIDQHMPGMAGLDVIATLQQQRVFLPAILITGRLDAAIAERAAALGVVAVLEKPFPAARLVELVRGALLRQA